MPGPVVNLEQYPAPSNRVNLTVEPGKQCVLTFGDLHASLARLMHGLVAYGFCHKTLQSMEQFILELCKRSYLFSWHCTTTSSFSKMVHLHIPQKQWNNGSWRTTLNCFSHGLAILQISTQLRTAGLRVYWRRKWHNWDQLLRKIGRKKLSLFGHNIYKLNTVKHLLNQCQRVH